MSAKTPIGVAGAIAVLGLTLGPGTPPTLAAEPVAFRLCVAEGALATAKCTAFGDPASYAVPAKQQLTIEQVSGDCGGGSPVTPKVQTVAIVAQTGGTVLPHHVLVVTLPDVLGGTVPLTSLRVYADAGSTVTMGLGDIVADDGGRFCRLVFSGLLERP